MVHIIGESRHVFAIADVKAIFVVDVLMGKGEHVMEADVLASPNVPNKGFTVDACGKGGDDASVGDIIEFVLTLCKVLDVVVKAHASLAFASQEVPQSARLSISNLEVVTELPLKVGPSFDHAFMKVV